MQRADPRARRAVLIVLVAGGVTGGMGLAVGRAWLRSLATRDVAEARQSAIQALGWVVAGQVVLLGALARWAWRLGTRIHRARRYPLPGQRVARDTRVLEGRDATRRGTLLQVVAGALVLAAIALLLAFARVRRLT